MRTPYSLRGPSVLYEDKDELDRKAVNDAIYYALRRKLRLARYDASFFRTLEENGEAAITWNYTRFNRDSEDSRVTFYASRMNDGSHELRCVGPRSDDVIERINLAIFDKTPKWLKKKLDKDSRRTESRRTKKKRLQRGKKNPKAAPKKKTRRGFINAPISFERNEVLTPQFRRSRLFWSEAIELAKYAFNVRGNWKYTARQVVVRELCDSLERSGYRFAQFKRGGFALRFDLIDGRWRGFDLTPITVACTKANTHPTYRRTRAWLRDTLSGLPKKSQTVRRDMLFHNISQAAA